MHKQFYREAIVVDLALRVQFAVSEAGNFPGEKYDFITYFDCLHDMGDPVASCRRAAQALKPDGCAMIVEPMAGNKIEQNFNLVGRIYSGASVMCCTPNAVSSGKHSLGTIASDSALGEVVKAGGFKHFRRAMATPLNRIFEATL
jgi:2-polyprenyl-3-methyl-5-hydroxy-6-metoxy-1,4-benzoquinol methylase